MTVAWTKVPYPFNLHGTPRIWFLPTPTGGVHYRDRMLIAVGVMGPDFPDIWTKVAKPTGDIWTQVSKPTATWA